MPSKHVIATQPPLVQALSCGTLRAVRYFLFAPASASAGYASFSEGELGRFGISGLLIRTDCMFPTLYQIRQQGRFTTPVAYATAHVAALFIKFFPRDLSGVFAPEMLPLETRRGIVAKIRAHSVRITHKTTVLRRTADDEEI